MRAGTTSPHSRDMQARTLRIFSETGEHELCIWGVSVDQFDVPYVEAYSYR